MHSLLKSTILGVGLIAGVSATVHAQSVSAVGRPTLRRLRWPRRLRWFRQRKSIQTLASVANGKRNITRRQRPIMTPAGIRTRRAISGRRRNKNRHRLQKTRPARPAGGSFVVCVPLQRPTGNQPVGAPQWLCPVRLPSARQLDFSSLRGCPRAFPRAVARRGRSQGREGLPAVAAVDRLPGLGLLDGIGRVVGFEYEISRPDLAGKSRRASAEPRQRHLAPGVPE